MLQGTEKPKARKQRMPVHQCATTSSENTRTCPYSYKGNKKGARRSVAPHAEPDQVSGLPEELQKDSRRRVHDEEQDFGYDIDSIWEHSSVVERVRWVGNEAATRTAIEAANVTERRH